LPSLEVSSVNCFDKSGFDGVVKTHIEVIYLLACVGTFVEAVGHGGIRCGSLSRYTVGKLPSGSGCKGDDGLGPVVDSNLSSPTVADSLDFPKAILGVAPALQDCLAAECDFATCFVKNTFQPALHRTAVERRLLTRPGS
jgi:hypothetical protein